MSDFLRSADGRFRAPTPTERFALLAPVQDGATGDLRGAPMSDDPLRDALTRQDDAAPPAPEPEPQPGPGPSVAAGKIPAGPRGSPPTGDLIRDTLRRMSR
jgi:hypothetical protein